MPLKNLLSDIKSLLAIKRKRQKHGENLNVESIMAPVFKLHSNHRLEAMNTAAHLLARQLPPSLPGGVSSNIKAASAKNKKSLEIPVLREWLTPSGKVFDVGCLSKDKNPLIIMFDARDRQRLAESLRQGAKMQAVGRLAGGLAHDFNNLLTTIIGYSDMLIERNREGDPSSEAIESIRQNAIRASNMVKQLLAFSREQVLQPKVLDLAHVVSEVWTLLTRLASVTVRLETNIANNIKGIEADPVQIEQILINLTINARDAMPFGGLLKISARNRSVKRPIPCRGDQVTVGNYVEMVVEDSGTGITVEASERIFDPFFTTKELGKGTGLGLAVVDGIMRQSGGYIFASNSESGLGGASFTLLFPAVDKNLRKTPKPKQGADTKDLTGEATVLLVEDESSVRLFATKALRHKGYTVLEAASGEAALAIAANHQFDILVTDLVMPEMSGTDLLIELRKKKPDLPCLCISGYAEVEIRDKLGSVDNISFLAKPFRLKQLFASVHKLAESKVEQKAEQKPKKTTKQKLKKPTKK